MLGFFFQVMPICVIICSKAQLAPIVQHLKSWILLLKVGSTFSNNWDGDHVAISLQHFFMTCMH
jgi:hypothetical protein